MTSISPKRNSQIYFQSINSPKKSVQPIRQNLHGVFLGGACNPTTWRKDVAIPFLESNQIPYFNPQVDEWYPELMALEAAAKEQASCLLFVFQPTLTRGLSSLVEVSYLAAQAYSQQGRLRVRSRPLLIVRPPYPFNLSVTADTDSFYLPLELESIEAAYQWLEGLRLPNVLFFDKLEEALDFIKTFYPQNASMGQRLTAKRKLRKLFKESDYFNSSNDALDIVNERMLEAYDYSPLCREITSNKKIDLYYGGAPPIFNMEAIEVTWVMPKANVQRDLMLTLAVQRRCSYLYFHISRHNFWLVEQMEAAFAIGCGKCVVLCVEQFNGDDNSLQSSGYSSLASTPEEVYRPTKGSAPSSASSSRSASTSEYEETTVTIKSKMAVLKPTDLTPSAIKDHNRSRSYLKSLFEGPTRVANGFLLDQPAKNIKDILLYIQRESDPRPPICSL